MVYQKVSVIICFIMLISGLKGDTPTVRYLNEFGEEVEGYLCAMTEEVQTVPHQSTTVPDGTYLIIPIAFHVIYNEDGDGYVPTYMIDDQMVFLNDIFNPSGIHFELFSTDWTENDYWYNQVPPYGQEREPQEVEMKQSLNQDPAHILNVYTAYPTGALGWGTFPMDFNENDPLRGVVMHFECITGGAYEPYNQGDLLVHEIGHCLGLYHTFQNGCLSPGDEVDDTPYQNKGQEHICDENKDTCPNDPGNDPIHNFMNYTDNNCTTEFTQGQYERMYSIIEEHSPSLIENTQVINVDYSDITSNIGGFLNVTVNLDLEFNNVESGSILQLELNSLYTVITQDEWIENKKHYGWGFNSDFLMETQSFLNLLGIARVWNAQFDEQVQINLQSTGPIEFYDPWYYDNATQTQPDDFRPVSPGQYQVFLNQYPIVGPAYALQAPEKYITMEEIYIFNRWEGNNVDFGGSTTSTTDLITDVVFEASGATVTAYYDNALTGTGMTVEIPAGETVNFPAGGTYLWDNANTGFVFDVEGSLVMNGTEENPITIGPVSGATNELGGIFVGNGGSLTMNYVNSSYQQYAFIQGAIWVDNGQATITNCRFMNLPDGAIKVNSAATVYIANSEFTGSQSAGSIGIDCEIDDSGNSVTIRNNTIVDFQTGVKTVSTSSGSTSTLDMRNNILYYNNFGQTGTICFDYNISSWLTVDVDYNNTYGFENNGSQFPFAYTQHWEDNTNPLFSNYSSGDYTLTSNSPVIDEGDPALGTDSDGTVADMGAYYFHQSPSAPTHFRIRGRPGQNPRLTYRHSEPDVNTFEILRSWDGGPFHLLAVVNETQYIDTEVIIAHNWSMTDEVCYKVNAVDDASFTSENSAGPQCELAEILKKEMNLPEEFALHNAFPNPFNPVTTIKYDIPEQSQVQLIIFDLLGRKINTLKNKTEEAGWYSLKWNGKDENGSPLSSGMYIVHISTQSLESEEMFVQSQKVVLLK